MTAGPVVNLLDNAVKYSPGGGPVELRVHKRDGRARIELADEGIGIAREAVPRVFEKFFRADPDKHGGVGGTIELDSEPWPRTTIVVELPSHD